jgi:TPP-dependent pyruvate/acetoin dehydrogenase alpha subunit
MGLATPDLDLIKQAEHGRGTGADGSPRTVPVIPPTARRITPMRSLSPNLPPDTQREMLRRTLTVRRFEERASADYLAGKIYGVVHCYIGEEAVAMGIRTTLDRGDRIISTHRSHGPCIAKTRSPTSRVPPRGKVDFAQDFFGRETFLTVSGQLDVAAYCLALSKGLHLRGRRSVPRTRTPAATSPSSG